MDRRSVVIGIHGLANKPPEEEKSRWWLAAMREGLERNLSAIPAPFAFSFVYWANLRYDAPLDAGRNREPYEPDPGLGAFPHFEDASSAAALSLTDRFYRLIDRLQEKTGLMPVDDLILEHRLDDLWGYYEDAGFRDAARGRLREALERHAGERILIAGHSMGGLIAYDVLRLMERDGHGRGEPPVAHLVTLGTPLGLAEVKQKLEAEHGTLRVPDTVGAWTHLVDHRDVATVGDDVQETYAPGLRGVRVRTVSVLNAYRSPSGRTNTHKSYGYLRTPEFSRALAAFLETEPVVAAAAQS